MRVLYFGSGNFAIEPLERLRESRHEVAGVVGRLDRRGGRGRQRLATPLVERARAACLPLWQPETLAREDVPYFEGEINWDAGVLVAYGGLVQRWLLEKPRYGFVNLHPSLLPRYRGAAPIQRALMSGATLTGVTTIQMNERLDEGDILLHHEEPINDDDSARTLGDRLSSLGARLLVETLDGLEIGDIRGIPQEEDKATFAPTIEIAEGNIDWERDDERIDRLVRALYPEPGAYTYFRGKRLKILEVCITDVPPEDESGTLMNMGKEGFLVNTGANCLRVVSVQPEGKRLMSAGEFSRGQRLIIGEHFTDRP